MSQNLISLMQRRLPDGPSLLDILRAEMDDAGTLSLERLREIAAETGVPEAAVLGVASYYADLVGHRAAKRVRCCVGTACFAAGAPRAVKTLERHLGVKLGQSVPGAAVALEPTYCLGHCGEGPSVRVESNGAGADYTRVDDAVAAAIAAGSPPKPSPEPRLASLASRPVVLRNLLEGSGVARLSEARSRGVYQALLEAVEHEPKRVLEAVEASGLRGRGGAGFLAAQKWRFAAGGKAAHKFVVCNADEGDPGSYLDRVLLERDPHSVLEGLALAGYAIGATRGYVYVRSEYPRALAVLRQAVSEAREDGLFEHPLGSAGFGFEVEVVEGAGSYVCGEETALLRSIEGLRGEVSARPPYPAVRGLFGQPTVVNNVETLQCVPWIVQHGGAAFAAMGKGKSTGTKVVSLNERFLRPGVYEVDLGTPVAVICHDLGGGLIDGAIKAVQIGGPLVGLLPAGALDTPLTFEDLEAQGAALGHGGMVAFDQRTDMRALALHLFEFGDAESCGKCFPCRLGMRRGLELVRSFGAGQAPAGAEELLLELCETMRLGSLCGHGGGLPQAIESIARHWPKELFGAGGAA